MRRLLGALFWISGLLTLSGIALGAYWYWSAGGPAGMARQAGAVAQEALGQWGREHPELATSLRRHLQEAAGRPDPDLTDLHQGLDAWLQENAEELAAWQGLTLAEDEDDLVRVLELRRQLTGKLAAGVEGGPAPAASTPEGVLEISGGEDTPGGVGAAHVEAGLELVPGEPAAP